MHDDFINKVRGYLSKIEGDISLIDLQKELRIPLPDLWMGLLLSGFQLEQRGDFYSNENVWILNSDITQ